MAEILQAQELNDYSISIAVFRDVSNCKELKELAMSGAITASLLQTQMILDRFQLYCAANKALHHHLHSKQITKALHSEVLFCLSPSKNISDAFKKFGISEKNNSVIILEIAKSNESKFDDICKHVKGESVSLDSLHDSADEKLIKQVYKVKDLELTVGTLVEAVVGRMACKEIVTF